MRCAPVSVFTSFLVVLSSVFLGACGKKGPPLPPLIRFPAPPTDLVAARRGSTVDLQFVVPNTNTDGSNPADVARVEVFALSSALPVTDDEIVRRGVRVGSVEVNPPPDPDQDPDVPQRDPEPSMRKGVDQGGTARLNEHVSSGNPDDTRSYVAVAISRRGRRGPVSRRAAVPLAAPPAAPPAPQVSYTETAINVAVPPVGETGGPSLAYHVYDATSPARRLTDRPLTNGLFGDSRIEWGAERCYVLRAVAVIGNASLESDPSPSTCVTLADTFPPATPTGLTAVGSEGAVNLIWNANGEKDLAGYIVLRALAPSQAFTPITPSPIQETTFRDLVLAGERAAYAVQAVDTAGNVSAMSSPIEETAR